MLIEDGVSKIVYDPTNIESQKFAFIKFKYANQVITFTLPYGDPKYKLDDSYALNKLDFIDIA